MPEAPKAGEDAELPPGPIAQIKEHATAPMSKRDFLRGRFLRGETRRVNPEGEITVRLTCSDQRGAQGVASPSSRTGLPPRLVRGRPPADVQRLVPLLFSICQRAQGAASAAAIAAAQGLESAAARPGAPGPRRDPRDAAGRRVAAPDRLAQGAWANRPRCPPSHAVRHASSAVVDDGATLDALLAVAEDVLREHVYGVPAEAWLASTDLAALDRWVERGATLPARLLRRMRDEAPGLGRSDVALMPDATLENLAPVAARRDGSRLPSSRAFRAGAECRPRLARWRARPTHR